MLTVTLGSKATFPRPLRRVPSEVLTDSLEMRTTASSIVTNSSGREDAPSATPGAMVFSLSRWVLLVGSFHGDFGDASSCAGLVDEGTFVITVSGAGPAMVCRWRRIR